VATLAGQASATGLRASDRLPMQRPPLTCLPPVDEDAVSESDPDGRPLSASDGSTRALRPDAIRFGSDGLVPAVVVDAGDREVLMLAWMNRESLERSLATGRTVFWSRSRQELWEKGATSGHVQRIVDIRTDCDQDALVISVEQTGAACHTGERSCFHHALTGPG